MTENSLSLFNLVLAMFIAGLPSLHNAWILFKKKNLLIGVRSDQCTASYILLIVMNSFPPSTSSRDSTHGNRTAQCVTGTSKNSSSCYYTQVFVTTWPLDDSWTVSEEFTVTSQNLTVMNKNIQH